MTRKQIEDLVHEWQHRLGLGDWRITVVWDSHPEEHPDGDALAEVNAQDLPYTRCHLRFHAMVTDWPRDSWGELGGLSADEVIVHELLHVAMARVDRAALNLDDGMLHRDVAEIRGTAYHEAREHFVDHLARALVAAHGGPAS